LRAPVSDGDSEPDFADAIERYMVIAAIERSAASGNA
jgi:hypothetical protein